MPLLSPHPGSTPGQHSWKAPRRLPLGEIFPWGFCGCIWDKLRRGPPAAYRGCILGPGSVEWPRCIRVTPRPVSMAGASSDMRYREHPSLSPCVSRACFWTLRGALASSTWFSLALLSLTPLAEGELLCPQAGAGIPQSPPLMGSHSLPTRGGNTVGRQPWIHFQDVLLLLLLGAPPDPILACVLTLGLSPGDCFRGRKAQQRCPQPGAAWGLSLSR